jgi:hypothetical protein
MKFQRLRFNKFLKALLFSLSLLICLNLLFMYILYLQTQNLRAGVPRPNFKTMFQVFKDTQLNYADVQNHVGLIEEGYEKTDTKSGHFDYKNHKTNWIYHPLTPALGWVLNIIIGSPFWSLCFLNQIILLGIFTGFYYWSRTNISGNERNLSAWIILLFFIIPPLGYFINFVTLPSLLLGILFFSFRHWLKSPQENQRSFWILIISSFLLGLARLQGLLVNASCLILIFIIIAWYKRPVGMIRLIIFSLANVLPFLITMGIFQYYANDPFAGMKMQKAWGHSLTMPWKPIIRYWKSGLVFNLQSDDLFFSSLRILVFFIFACIAVKVIISKKKFIKDLLSHRYDESFINLYFIAVSLGLLILIFFTDLMVGIHRLATLAFLIILIWFEQSRKFNRLVLLFLMFLRAVEFTLFVQGVRAFIW